MSNVAFEESPENNSGGGAGRAAGFGRGACRVVAEDEQAVVNSDLLDAGQFQIC
jgi:uncharacterized protein (UPF0254 family)